MCHASKSCGERSPLAARRAASTSAPYTRRTSIRRPPAIRTGRRGALLDRSKLTSASESATVRERRPAATSMHPTTKQKAYTAVLKANIESEWWLRSMPRRKRSPRDEVDRRQQQPAEQLRARDGRLGAHAASRPRTACRRRAGRACSAACSERCARRMSKPPTSESDSATKLDVGELRVQNRLHDRPADERLGRDVRLDEREDAD